jgi:hypothetical protein
MELEIVRPVMISGEPVAAGSIVDVAVADGCLLMGLGKARLAPEKEPVKPAKKTAKLTTEE